MNNPRHTVKDITRHEWVIGEGDRATTARDLKDGIALAEHDMAELGVNLNFDDAYRVRGGDCGEVILYVEL